MSLKYQNETDEVPQREIAVPVESAFPIYTLALLGAIAVVTVAQFYAGLNLSIDRAGFDKPLFIHAHEYWRILTGAVLHGGPLHVFMNGYALYSFGRFVELLSNRAHLAIVFLLSAIGGGLLSLWAVPNGVSVGASGGIVGLISYLAVYAFRRRQFVSAEFRKNLLINIGFILVFGLVLYQVIDNYGHIGGLIVGAVYGFVQIPSDEYVDPRKAGTLTEIAGLLSLGIYIAAAFFSVYLILN